jgi:hypothetical protein
MDGMFGMFQVLENDGNTAKLACCEEVDSRDLIGVVSGKSEIIIHKSKNFDTKRFIKLYPPGRFSRFALSTAEESDDDKKWARSWDRLGLPFLSTPMGTSMLS